MKSAARRVQRQPFLHASPEPLETRQATRGQQSILASRRPQNKQPLARVEPAPHTHPPPSNESILRALAADPSFLRDNAHDPLSNTTEPLFGSPRRARARAEPKRRAAFKMSGRGQAAGRRVGSDRVAAPPPQPPEHPVDVSGPAQALTTLVILPLAIARIGCFVVVFVSAGICATIASRAPARGRADCAGRITAATRVRG